MNDVPAGMKNVNALQAVVVAARLLFVLLGIAVCVFIWVADNGVPNALLSWLRGVRHGDKYMHFLIYGSLAFLLHLSLRGRGWRVWRLVVPVAAVAVLAFGLGEEISQLFSPRRQFDWIDLACNLAGVTCFTLLAQGVLFFLRRLAPAQPSSAVQRS